MLLTCLFSLVVLVSSVEGSLQMLKVRLPPVPDRDEKHDISEIYRILEEAAVDPDVKVVLSVKEIGNPVVHAVLDIKTDFKWAVITDQLAARGYDYSTVPIYSCGTYSNKVDDSMTHTPNFKNGIKHLARLIFPINGISSDAYETEVIDVVNTISTKLAQNGWNAACYMQIFKIPYQFYLFTDVPESADHRIGKRVETAAGHEVIAGLRLVQSLDEYVQGANAMGWP